jgi:hypothetical protein
LGLKTSGKLFGFGLLLKKAISIFSKLFVFFFLCSEFAQQTFAFQLGLVHSAGYWTVLAARSKRDD